MPEPIYPVPDTKAKGYGTIHGSFPAQGRLKEAKCDDPVFSPIDEYFIGTVDSVMTNKITYTR